MKPLLDTHSSASTAISSSILAGIFFTAMSVLAYQVGLTRVFSIIMWHHHAYLVVSVALLGFGASGSYVAVQQNGIANQSGLLSRLNRYALAHALTIPASYLVVTRMQIHSMNLLGSPENFLAFLFVLGLLAVPFFFAGLVMGVCFQAFSQQAGRLYGADLLGAALGAFAAPFLLHAAGVNGTAMAAAFFAGLGALFFSQSASWGRRIAAGLVALCLLACVGFSTNTLFWEIPLDPSKQEMSSAYTADPRITKVFSTKIPFSGGRHFVWKRSAPDMTHHAILHSAIAQLDIWPEHTMPMLGGGEFGKIDRQTTPMRMVTQDGIGPTFLYKDAGNLKKFPSLDDSQIASAYVAQKALDKTRPDVLVIGVGGGIDVMTALYHNAGSVTGVEINRAMIRMVTRDYAGYLGHLFSDPRITLIREDGRSFLNRDKAKYDIIQLTGVDTLTALSTGAYTLSENYLYTVQAIQTMVGRLKEGGIICYSRPIFSPPHPPRETLRLANTARAALEGLGMESPWQNIAVLQAGHWASTMIKNGPFTREECQTLTDFSNAEGFKGLVFNPWPDHTQKDFPGDENLRQTKKQFLTVMAGEDEERNEFMQQSPFNLSPPTDSKPFFFNYYKMSNVPFWWGRGASGNMWTEFIPEFPAGHMILAVAVIQATLLAGLFILIPVWFWNQKGILSPGKGRTLAYFGALGLGFMFVEICLMQKFILFLGHPTYAVSVVLAGMLAFAGAGAWFSERLPCWTRKNLLIAGLTALALNLANAFLLDFFLDWLPGLPLGLRIIAALVLIAPSGFVLGLFFPLGIRTVGDTAPEMVAWAWAINGFFTVLGSVLAIVAAMTLGFTWVLVLAGLIYLAGLCLGPEAVKKRPI
ncbi:MAG: hypothetical protein JEZ02_09345 [Desulfatibacillum sp.]|nr:hypothetical protein [Desulfatibacillum sp.]